MLVSLFYRKGKWSPAGRSGSHKVSQLRYVNHPSKWAGKTVKMLEGPSLLTHQQRGRFKNESHLFLSVSSAVVAPWGWLRAPVTSASQAPITSPKEEPIMRLLVMHVWLLVISSMWASAKNPVFLTRILAPRKHGGSFSLVGVPIRNNTSLISEFAPFPSRRLMPWQFRSSNDLLPCLLVYILTGSFLSVSGLPFLKT